MFIDILLYYIVNMVYVFIDILLYYIVNMVYARY